MNPMRPPVPASSRKSAGTSAGHGAGVAAASLALLASLAACRTPSSPQTETLLTHRGDVAAETSTLYGRDVVLSPEAPEDAWCGVRLLQVSASGEATIRVLASGAELRASPGGYFSGEDFGRIGLEYLAFDSRARRVTLRRFWCENTVGDPTGR